MIHSAESAPRVLVLSGASFNRIHGAGITLSNLFAGWPRDRLAMAHCDTVPPTNEICERYFELTGEEIRRLGPFLGMRAVSAPPAATRTNRRTFKARVRQIAFGNMPPDSGRLTIRLQRWIADFEPDVLYTILGSNAMMELALAICEMFSTKLVVHFLDDWASFVYRGGVFSFAARHRMNGELREIVARARLRFGISPAMCDAYAARFHQPFTPFMNAVDMANYGARPANDASTEVLYVGSIVESAYLESIVEACKAAALLQDTGIRLTILTSAAYLERHRDRLAIAPNVTVAEAPPDGPEFIRLIQAARVLLLPVNFDPISVGLIRYSLPTKVPAYLASGTPILAYGPANIAQIEYARHEGWAHIVSGGGVAALAAAMERLVRDEPLRASLSARAIALAHAEHDLSNVRERFQSVLSSVV